MPDVLETIDGTDFDLLKAVKARLLEKVPKLTEGLVMICDEPIPPKAYFPRGDLACTLALTDGKFDEAKYNGGAANQLTETKQLVVTMFTRVKIDQPPRAEYSMLDPERGLLSRYKPLLLGAILVDDLSAALLQPWQPLKSGRPIIRGSITPDRSQGPRQAFEDWMGLSLFFHVDHDWELRAPVTE